MYFKFGKDWVMGSSREAIVVRHRSFFDQLFLSMSGRSVRSKNAEIRDDIATVRNDRIGRANASAAGTAHLPETEEKPQESPAPQLDDPLIEVANLEAFEEELS
jgi:hypothetical protein